MPIEQKVEIVCAVITVFPALIAAIIGIVLHRRKQQQEFKTKIIIKTFFSINEEINIIERTISAERPAEIEERLKYLVGRRDLVVKQIDKYFPGHSELMWGQEKIKYDIDTNSTRHFANVQKINEREILCNKIKDKLNDEFFMDFEIGIRSSTKGSIQLDCLLKNKITGQKIAIEIKTISQRHLSTIKNMMTLIQSRISGEDIKLLGFVVSNDERIDFSEHINKKNEVPLFFDADEIINYIKNQIN
ncbi:hypothetical protein [Mycoplasma todarodis]|uniref:hypothetical protein n=1 Tax=Mycoplasma todarodis TaxID=1937191 RepID=UPI003B347DB3